jgi:transcription-repair coupling factor (superfamily II helicase)
MDWLKDKVFATDVFRELKKSLKDGDRLTLKNVPGPLPMLVADFVSEKLLRPVLMVTESLEDAEEAADDLTTLLSDGSPCLLPGRPAYGRALTPVELSERAEVLLALTQGDNPVIVTHAGALLDTLPPPGAVSQNMYAITKGETLSRDSLLKYLVDSGYKREVLVEGVGQFAVRGAVVDIYPFGAPQPVRIEFFGEDVESLRMFDPTTQKSTGETDKVTLMAAEVGHAETSHLLEHLPANAVIVWSDGRGAWNALKKSFDERSTTQLRKPVRDFSLDELEEEDAAPGYGDLDEDDEGEAEIFSDEEIEEMGATDDRPPLLIDHAVVKKAARQFTQLFLSGSPHGDEPVLDVAALPQERFAANLPLVADRLKEYHAEGMRAVLLCDSQLAGERLAQVLYERGCPEDAFEIFEDGLHHGFTMPAAKLAVLVDHDIFGRVRRRRRFMKFKNVVPLHDIDALKPGDFVVHVDYGIGRYKGLTKIEVGHVQREVLKIEYRDGVTLFVKLENLAQVQKYSGREGFHPPLSKIGGRDWRDLKKKTKKSLLSIAEDLIQLYAQRKAVRGIQYSGDTPWQREMEASFPYEDTPDQMRAAEDVKSDMESGQPMDRLICGDVGYGKTEVAMRAAFKAVTDGKQVAVLVPTTILAQQHYRTFKERYKQWPVKVEVISRFQAAREQRVSLKKLEDGKVDVIIGTHRLLSKDVKFSDLGLLIIDEEHRFGVVQKERIKSIRANIDVLSMSATPIPRTLHMALMGARDLSQINTPPPNRQPIETDVVAFSEKVIKDAILYETERGGQVFFVHNRIESIPAVKRMLERILPNVRFGVAHGQMDEQKLSHIMVDFIEGNFDVLISTMIIESGLDLPNVNTMIVNRADHFGVAQLHQLRGRIGRSSRKAYAYLLVPPKFEMSRIARERLAALTNFSSLGAGFQVAMRDLEIRGAGNLLGREQSGYINAVGFEMYQRLIEEAVREVQTVQLGEAAEPEPVELKLKISADAFFPEDYMPEGGMRLNYYRELSRTKNLEGVDEIERDVADRFGRLPEAAQNLFDMVRVRILGEKLVAEKISIERNECDIEFPKDGMSRDKVLEIARRGQGYPVEFSASGPLRLTLPLGMTSDWREKLIYVIKYLAAISGVSVMELVTM